MINGYQQEILKTYENLRTTEEKKLAKKRKEISEEIPEVIGIENQIASLSLNMSLNIMRNKNNLQDYIKNVKEQITKLRIRKSELLVANGYSSDYLETHYTCNKCKDTGFIKNTRCSCYKKHLVNVLYKNSDINYLLKTNNFENFNFEYFSPQKSITEPKSPRENIKKIMSTAWNFIEQFPNTDENLLFFGKAGTGKSFLANCIAKELLDKGYMVVYRTAVELINNLKQSRFNGEVDLEDLLIDCDLLIIDDLGTESLNEFSKIELFNLLNRKLLKRKNMIISTNFSLEDLARTYSERTSSRLLGNFTLCKFYGHDIRVRINVSKKK